MSEKKFTKDHEWIALDGKTGTVGITIYAQEQLGDVVFVELPSVGKVLAKGDQAAVVESVKAASEVYSPTSGKVTAVNQAIVDDPAKVNQDPEGSSWFFKLEINDSSELSDLMDKKSYDNYKEGGGH
ncbi:MAG: glycine cleavage system protein GcvH [Alphaproteobacteria bacterium]